MSDCSGPAQAIQIAAEISPKVILLDLVIPKIDGLTLVVKLPDMVELVARIQYHANSAEHIAPQVQLDDLRTQIQAAYEQIENARKIHQHIQSYPTKSRTRPKADTGGSILKELMPHLIAALSLLLA